MAKKKYTEEQVLRDLRKKNDLMITGHEIRVLTGEKHPKQNDIGIKSWGKIDYLTSRQGYYVRHVDKF